MNISYKWLKDFTDFDLTPEQLRDLITSRAVTVDELENLSQDLKDVVIGQVVDVRPHPDSEHLNLTKVDSGTGELWDVVCGAPNVEKGVKYPFAPIGSVLPGGFKIEKRKIRGETSSGMLCSARELGLGQEHDGILPLNTEAAPGTPFLQAFNVGDSRLVLDVGANRADALSHEGVAREVAAATGVAMARPTLENLGDIPPVTRVLSSEHVIGDLTVSVSDTAGAPVYIGVVIRGVRVASSPAWLTERLDGAGVRSINNIVDATNYILHGLGHPMHAFDLDKISGKRIEVRAARAGETIRTLDGVDRKLSEGMTVIADAQKPQAIAGVMGAEESEVTDDTTNIFLEIAVFDPEKVRNTRKKIGVSTDASYRFERAMDRAGAAEVARYASALITQLAGGTVESPLLLFGDDKFDAPVIKLRESRVAKLLGDVVPADECKKLLESVGFSIDGSADAEQGVVLSVRPPSWRTDVTLEVDLIEELARLRGYDSFSNELRPYRPGTVPDSPSYVVTRRVSEALVAAGYFEVRPIPFVADAGENGVRLTNPMAETEGMLRSDLLSTLGKRVEYNFSHMVSDIRLFEVGVAFSKKPGTVEGQDRLPVERTVAAAMLTGDRFPVHFTDARPPQLDIWDAKWIANVICNAAYGSGKVRFMPQGGGWDLVHLDDTIGRVGHVVECNLDSPVWASPVYGVEVDITPALSTRAEHPVYKPFPSMPASEFDLALLLDSGVSAEQVENIIRIASGELLESLVLFDEFKGKGVPEGFRSVAWRLTLRHPDRTLREKEIEGRRKKILQTLDKELGVKQRIS